MKEGIIKEYLSKIDWKSDWSYKIIIEDLGKLLGEKPAIDISYRKDIMINEISGDASEIKEIDKITILYSDIEKGNNAFNKVEIKF